MKPEEAVKWVDDRMSQRQKDVIASNLATQISLFDYAFNPYQD